MPAVEGVLSVRLTEQDYVLGKSEVIVSLARQAGLWPLDAWANDVPDSLNKLLEYYDPNCNMEFAINVAGEANIVETVVYPSARKFIKKPINLSERHRAFLDADVTEVVSPKTSFIEIKNGTYVNYLEAPLIIDGNNSLIIRDYSSRFVDIVRFIDRDVRKLVAGASKINGTAFVLGDDVRPLNYCHWLLDTITKLAVIDGVNDYKDTYIITTNNLSDFQIETLHLLGYANDRIIPVEDFSAVTADRLIATNDLSSPPHPAFKTAPWAISFLRSTLGMSALSSRRSRRISLDLFDRGNKAGKKIYVSRGDAGGRRIENEEELFNALKLRGFERVFLSGRSLRNQIELFAQAERVIGIHGAGLTNTAFMQRNSKVVEIFPATYGTACYYLLTAALNITYATYVSNDIVTGPNAQMDGVKIDVSDFIRKCEMHDLL